MKFAVVDCRATDFHVTSYLMVLVNVVNHLPGRDCSLKYAMEKSNTNFIEEITNNTQMCKLLLAHRKENDITSIRLKGFELSPFMLTEV